MLSNVLGTAGLLGLVTAVWGLTGSPWWALLVASLLLLAVAYALYTHTPPLAAPAAAPPAPAGPDRNGGGGQ